MKKENIKKEEGKYISLIHPSGVSLWILLIAYLLSLLLLIINLMSLILVLLSLACAVDCVKLAKRMKKNNDIAYIIGFIFSLIGLIIYWIYYKNKSKDQNSLIKYIFD